MLKQEKILIFFKVIYFILFKIKFFKINIIDKKFTHSFCKKRKFYAKYHFFRSNFNTKILKKKFKISFEKFIIKKLKRKIYYKKIVVNKNFFFFVRDYKRNFRLFFFEKIKNFNIFKKTQNLFFNNLFFYKYKKFIFKNFKSFYKKKSKLFVSIKKNNFFYLQTIYLNKKLLFISNSKLFDGSVKFKTINKAANKLLLLNLLKIIYKYKVFSFNLVLYVKKKRRLKKKGLNKRTKNFLTSYCFFDYLKIYKFFKIKKYLNIDVTIKVSFIKSHSKRTEKLKKKRRK